MCVLRRKHLCMLHANVVIVSNILEGHKVGSQLSPWQ